jgi:hypothetical protein
MFTFTIPVRRAGELIRGHRPLLADLKEFVHDHRFHGALTADATEADWNGYLLTVACRCGVVFGRWITLEDAKKRELRLVQTGETKR